MLDPHSAAQPPVRPDLRPGPAPETDAGTRTVCSRSVALLAAARTLLNTLEAGRALSTPVLRTALTLAFGATDARGAWLWKDAYDAAEAAVVLFVRRYGMAMRRQAGAGPQGPAAMLAMLERLAALEPSHTRRSEEQQRLQQFSTPLPLAYSAVQAAMIRPGDRVLEPSAGTGILAVMAHCALRETASQRLYLNELAATRAGLLQALFPGVSVDRHNAESIADYLPGLVPSVVLMNPPFSASPGVDRRRRDADLRHIRSAFSMLPPGGRLVAITSHSCVPGNPAWQSAFHSLDPPAQAAFSMAIDGRAYARHGTSFDTRLTVLDRLAAGQSDDAAPGRSFDPGATAPDAAALLAAVQAHVPPRLPLGSRPGARRPAGGFSLQPPPSVARNGHAARPGVPAASQPEPANVWGSVAELEYETASEPATAPESDSSGSAATQPHATGPYEPWRPATVTIAGAQPHPTPLVQSAAMAAVAHPRPAYRPKLPVNVIGKGRLSDAQLESIILAGQAHERRLPAHVRIGEGWETLQRVDGAAHSGPADSGPADGGSANGSSANGNPADGSRSEDGEVLSSAVRFRRGWMLGDGTGCGKGRQVAGIVLDQRLRGNRRALWLSASDKLLEDARRDWTAIGGVESDVIPLTKIRTGKAVPQAQGILFATYATLRSPARQGRQSRLKQIVQWLAGGLDEDSRHGFSGVIVFDEAHAMANAAGSKGARGDVAPSQQGRAGLRLQNALPDARILYVSATGATTLAGLAYAQRLGLWGTEETPFEKRTDFVSAMESGGVAAMEVVARDLKALGLYQARALSYDGVEVELLEHALTDEQRRIYDAYAEAFKIIHSHLEQALQSTGISDAERTLNRNAKSAAMSAFEGAKQRFFGHLLTSMKCPALIRAMENDREAGRASVIQLVSTGEALMERRIAEVPTSEWNDLNIDLTPRESILSYLAHAFPVQLQEPFTDEEGNLMSRPVHDDDGNPVLSQEAVAARDALIERLAALPAVPAALDQLLHHFGHEAVAEVTGRSRRVLKIVDAGGERLALKSRPASANLSETAAFMEGSKKILVFSMAGGTGRSYHAALDCGHTARRVHYLLEPGWRAELAIQGLGRTHRTHQASAPVFRPVTTDVKGERRFIATIARRLDSLGALTRGQRDSQTALGDADAALFKARDNLESPYARAALRQFYGALWAGYISGWSLDRFETATGLKLTWEGNLKEDLPPMPKFLNRLLALPIDEQNELFAQLEERIDANIEQAMEAGTYEQGVENILADSLRVASREVLQTHERTGAATELVEIVRRDRLRPLTAEAALQRRDQALAAARKAVPGCPTLLMVNARSNRAAVRAPAPSRILDDGGIQPRVRLLRPASRDTAAEDALAASHWREADETEWRTLWDSEVQSLPSHSESRLWLVTGLLLPVWDRLPREDLRVRRLQTDDRDPLIGRVLNPEQATALRRAFGLGAGPLPSAAEVHEALTRRGAPFSLANGWRLVRRRMMGTERMEIEGPVDTDLPALKRLGCVTEIVSWRTRVFVPGAQAVERLLSCYPIDGGPA